MRIFIISLKRSVDRRKVMSEHLARLGLDFEFINGVDGNKLSPEEISKLYDEKWAFRQEGRHLSRGEIGCSLSHLKVYRKIVNEDLSYALILEDDVCLSPLIAGVLKAIEDTISPNMNEVFLMQENSSVRFKKKGKKVYLIDGQFVFEELKSAQGTYAYVVTHNSAQSMVKTLTPVTHTADSWGWLIRQKIVNVYGINRTFSTHNDYDLNSVIGLERFTRKKWKFDAVTHKLYRVYWLMFDIILSKIKHLR